MAKGIVEADLTRVKELLEAVLGHSDYTNVQRMGGSDKSYILCRVC